jgi:serine protease AprX
MTQKVKYIAALLILATLSVSASQKYCIYFTDKQGSSFNAAAYFGGNEINRPIDSSDFPLVAAYVKSIENIAGPISSQSRWLNAVVVSANARQIELMGQYPFVKKTEPLRATVKLAKYKFKATLHTESYRLMTDQVASMQGERFHQKGLNGKGVRVAIFDAGFTGADKSPLFEHLHKNGQIVGTYDFVKKNENVYAHNHHGTMVLSCLAGIFDGRELGLATGAEFLLARTESNLETLNEEEYWLQAVEWAYRNGADIINSSLGYTYHRYFAAEMDGQTSLVAKAAAMAAEKGILVVNSMGNDGQNNWEFVCTPADVENVMAVGGIDPNTGIHIPFSSFGPTADKRMKPNVSAYGHVVAGSNKKLTEAYGTSFASPLVAGFAACVMQMNPGYGLDKLFDEIEKSGHLYPYFDYAHGYGIPQAGYFVDAANPAKPLADIALLNQTVIIHTFDEGGKVFYHIQQPNGVLEKYSVVEVSAGKTLQLPLEDVKGKTLRAYYKGATIERSF